MNFTHFDDAGRAVMVDVSAKQPTLRTAIAEARVILRHETLMMIQQGSATKGDVLGVARLAGITAAKKTADLIPLAHPLPLHAVSVDFEDTNQPEASLIIRGQVTAFDRTGVEMEAMIAVSLAALTVYDMCKGIDRGITISDVTLLYKAGGKSGIYRKEKLVDT